jgi:hypothetical protein
LRENKLRGTFGVGEREREVSAKKERKEGTARNGCPMRRRSIDLRKSKPMEMAK